jgi:peroxiredoxin
MKKIILSLAVITSLVACSTNEEKGKFTLNGELKNIEDQKVYLEQLFFSPNKNPEVLDTAEIKGGKFTSAAIASEEGLYRLRFEKQQIGYIFVNDKSNIKFTADVNDASLQGPEFNSPANKSLKSFLLEVNSKQETMTKLSASIDSLKAAKNSDSLVAANITTLNNDGNDFKKFIIKSIDSIENPVVAMFALGYTRGIEPSELKEVIPHLAKRFPNHLGVAGIIKQYDEMIAKKNAPQPPTTTEQGTKKAGIGSMAPEITMQDTLGNPFSLSSLKGKYVLVDFWASWCMPCRGENPNVVANYNKYKNKNFTILGVSLDEDKAAWTKAIIKDKLSWKQVSDLKGWACAATGTYGFDAIPYNVLLDPSGKIIATELREGDLGKKLGEVLR